MHYDVYACVCYLCHHPMVKEFEIGRRRGGVENKLKVAFIFVGSVLGYWGRRSNPNGVCSSPHIARCDKRF